MAYDFGCNCRHYLPSLGKCRLFVDRYRARPDLVGERILCTRDVLVYLNLSTEELVGRIASGEIKAKLQKDGKSTFSVRVAWQYDDCPLADAGGHCFRFEAHEGKSISCLAELDAVVAEHPNWERVPSDAEVTACENEVLKGTQGMTKEGGAGQRAGAACKSKPVKGCRQVPLTPTKQEKRG